MRALLIDGFGEPASARIGEIARPRVGPDDLLVRVHAVSLNPVDWKEMAGMLAGFYPPYPSPWVPGFDGSGTVEVIGKCRRGVLVRTRCKRYRPPGNLTTERRPAATAAA